MSLASDLKTIYYLTLRPHRGHDHAARMENFYAAQADSYDSFRQRLLHGRRELYQAIPLPHAGTWIDLGAGTGQCLDFLGDAIGTLRHAYLVDLSPSMLAVARRRIAQVGAQNVHAIQADAATFRPATGLADVVTFAYALSMIPDWPAALDQACALLKPGGLLGVIDFYTSPRHAAPGMVRHSWLTRTFWPAWFARGGVTVSADLLPTLQHRLATVSLTEARGTLPYLPLARIPWFIRITLDLRAGRCRHRRT